MTDTPVDLTMQDVEKILDKIVGAANENAQTLNSVIGAVVQVAKRLGAVENILTMIVEGVEGAIEDEKSARPVPGQYL